MRIFCDLISPSVKSKSEMLLFHQLLTAQMKRNLQVRNRLIELVSILFVATALPLIAADGPPASTEKAVSKFKELDRDENGRLSLAEYVARREPADLYRRDFLIFDFDHDSSLSFEEFAPIALGVQGLVRGPIPDPLVQMVDSFLADLDKSLTNWNERPAEEIPIETFVSALPAGYQLVITPDLLKQGDADHNGKFTRHEARRFVENQFGIRLPGGRPLRMANGVVNNYLWFLGSDRNQDDQIEWPEFMVQTGGAEVHQRNFSESDQDGDRIVSLDEWFISKWTIDDPIENFRNLDVNHDGFVDTAELDKGSPPWKKTNLDPMVNAFDEDRDRRLSLNEYRLTPHANMILGWHQPLFDLNQDQKLSRDEYRFQRPLFPMLREFYFQKFDRNHDGFLDWSEFQFKTEKPFEMYVMNADGTGLKRLDVGKIVRFGSPAVSPDGKWVLFDGTTEFTYNVRQWQVQMMPISGGTPKSICDGVMPSWSEDGLKLTCSRFQPQYGIWIVDVDGNDSQFVQQGWGSQWSPDGKKIALPLGNSLQIYDTFTKETETIVGPGESNMVRFDIHCTWSPDSQRICIIARKSPNAEMTDIVIVDLAAQGNEKTRVRYSGKSIGGDFAWRPDGRRVICSMYCEERRHQQFYEFDPDAENGQFTLIPGQIENKMALDITWTPDGKQLIFNVAADE